MSKLSGKITINGSKRKDEKFRNISAYVLQDDNMYAHLTVFETLLLSAHFFLSESIPDSEKISLVEAVIAELGLIKARDTIIGDEKVRGVSGGERKRASVAVQLLSDPAVLFLDEPTSGLDGNLRTLTTIT
jgi:ABC-type multidrug transport system ATPase subunit